MTTVSVVIPTIGRPSLAEAVKSALAQSVSPVEVIVVYDDARTLDLPRDHRLRVVRSPSRVGASRARQLGVEAAKGDVIALLDDDDIWYPHKLEAQLKTFDELGPVPAIVSACVRVVGGGPHHTIWPSDVISEHESVGQYLFEFRRLRFGGASLPTSTLMFPRELAVPWTAAADAVHDDPTWLLAVRAADPMLKIVQIPEALAEYRVTHDSVSRSCVNRTDDYVQWGLEHLATHSARVRGDYFLTSAVSVAASFGSMRSILFCVRTGFRHGRPGRYAVAFAALNAARVIVRTRAGLRR